MAPLRYKMKLKFQKKLVAGKQDKKNIFQQEGYQLDRL
jgi:hypothetical protein